MKTFTQIDTTGVTPEQIGSCFKIFYGSKAAYKVQSESDYNTQYTVGHTPEHGFTCTCPSGEYGFANTKAGYCKHVKYAVACEKEVRAAVAGLENATAFIEVEEPAEIPTLIVNGQAADLDTINRVFIEAKPLKTTNAKGYSPKAFSILK